MSKLLAVGSDYEVFVRPIDSDQVVSAIPLISGDKDRRIQLKTCEIHHDNVLAEVNIVPCASKNDFGRVVRASLDELASFLNTTGHTYVIADNVIMSEKELRHVDACEFGCSEDYDIYKGVVNIAPSAILAGNLRTAGGHIHISYTFRTRDEYRTTALLLSTILSLGTTIMGDSHIRRELYGKAGSVRLKEYGVEVRTPSNIWLSHIEWIDWIYYAIACVCRVSTSTKARLEVERLLGSIIYAVDTCDISACRSIFKSVSKVTGLRIPPLKEAIQAAKFSSYSGKIKKPSFYTSAYILSPEDSMDEDDEDDDSCPDAMWGVGE